MFLSIFEENVTLAVTGPFPPPLPTSGAGVAPLGCGAAGAGVAPRVPAVTAPPLETVSTHAPACKSPAPGCTCAEAPGGPGSSDGALGISAVLGTAAVLGARAG